MSSGRNGRRGGERGEGEAQCKLGGCYCYGEGVEKDEAEAVKWYRKAAEQGRSAAQCNLGSCYESMYTVM